MRANKIYFKIDKRNRDNTDNGSSIIMRKATSMLDYGLAVGFHAEKVSANGRIS